MSNGRCQRLPHHGKVFHSLCLKCAMVTLHLVHNNRDNNNKCFYVGKQLLLGNNFCHVTEILVRSKTCIKVVENILSMQQFNENLEI